MTLDDQKRIAKYIIKYNNEVNHPTIENNIEIKNNTILLKINNQVIISKKIPYDKIKKDLEKMVYQKNTFRNIETKYSPFEADKHQYKDVWKNSYNRINFPKFMPVGLMCVLLTGEFPSLVDFTKIYMLSYIKRVVPSEGKNERFKLYKDYIKDDRTRLGMSIIFADGEQLTNRLLQFREEFKHSINNFPINEFTTEQLCNRIHKVYGSIIRDIYNALYFSKHSLNTYYSLLNDYLGIDLFINGIPVYAYTNTTGGQEFRKKKILYRHPKLNPNIGIKLEKDVYKENWNQLYLVSDQTIIEIRNKLNEGINEIITVLY